VLEVCSNRDKSGNFYISSMRYHLLLFVATAKLTGGRECKKGTQ